MGNKYHVIQKIKSINNNINNNSPMATCRTKQAICKHIWRQQQIEQFKMSSQFKKKQKNIVLAYDDSD